MVNLSLTLTLMLTPKPKVWNVLKKEKKKWSPELKCATLLPKRKSPRCESNQKPLAQQTSNVSTTLQCWCHSNGKLNVLFEPHHARRFNRHYLYLIKAVATGLPVNLHISKLIRLSPVTWQWHTTSMHQTALGLVEMY